MHSLNIIEHEIKVLSWHRMKLASTELIYVFWHGFTVFKLTFTTLPALHIYNGGQKSESSLLFTFKVYIKLIFI